MCNLSHPVFRIGAILDADLGLSREQASAVADAVTRDHDRFANAIGDALAGEGHALVGVEPDPAVIRADPAIVVNLPGLHFRADDGNRIDARASVTVCERDRQSKCWVRISPAVESKPADDAALVAFFDEAEEIGKTAVKALADIYRNTIDAALGVESGLSIGFEISVKSASGSDPMFDQTFSALFYGDRRDEDPPGWQAVATAIGRIDPELRGWLDKPLREATGGEHTRRTIGIATPRLSEDPDDPFETHTVNGVFSLTYDDRHAEFVGVGYDEYAEQVPLQKALSNVVGTQIAREYGGLF